MLKKMWITNSSGISETVELDFNRGKYSYREEFIKDDIVSPAVLYGRNSSGKTSVLKTVLNIIKIFSEDLTSNANYAMNNVFFEDEETKIILEFRLKDNDYVYYVEIKNRNEIVYECLEINGVKEYTRKDDIVSILKLNSFIPKGLEFKPKLSFIRMLGMHEFDKQITEVYNYFKSFRFVATNKNISSIGTDDSQGELLVKYNDAYSKYLDKFEHIMKLRFELEYTSDGREIISAFYLFKENEYKLDFETMISSGTKDLYTTLALMLSLKPGSLLVIDEIEKTFHPELLDILVKEIIAKMDIQVLCSSHNTHLLQALRPDQIFFTKKENEIVKVERLSEIHPGIREIHNIEKLYLGGRFE